MPEEKPQLGKTDKKILQSLLEDGRKTFTEIGEEVGLSYATISLRVKKMKERGLIKHISPKINWTKTDLSPFFIFVKANPGKLQEAKKWLNDESRCIFLAPITGEYDLIAFCLFKDRKSLSQFVQQLLQERVVRQTVTSQVLDIEKDFIPPKLFDLL